MSHSLRGLRPSKELHDEWAKNLKESGFVDVEQFLPCGEPYTQLFPALSFSSDQDLVQAHYTESVYRLAGLFLHNHKFKNENDRQVWECFSEGITIRETALRTGVPSTTCFRILKKLKAKMYESANDLISEEDTSDDDQN